MTLNTKIYILDEVDPYEVFYFCNRLLKAENPEFTEGASEWNPPGVLSIGNKIGQGFPALLDLEYRHNGPLFEEAQYDQFDEDDEPYETYPPCYLTLSFDTAYGYRDEFGGCDNLHARYIVELHKWLQEKGVRLQWVNEYTGEKNDGIDGLESFFSSGDAKDEWFQNTLLPVFMKMGIDPVN